MEMRTETEIDGRQRQSSIKPATGDYATTLDALSKACLEAIKILELEKAGIRDGDGFWHGSDVIGAMTRDLTALCRRLLGSVR
jgi:hypothetical protein